MTNELYRAPAAKVDNQSHDPLLAAAPLGVRIAITISWLVLVVETLAAFWRIYGDAEASADRQFQGFWIATTIATATITGLLVFQTSRRHNWARLALLAWTLGSWCLWILWPQNIADYAWWKWMISGTLTAAEFAALVLLFRASSTRWYKAETRAL